MRPDGTWLFIDSKYPCDVEIYADGQRIDVPNYEVMEARGTVENLLHTPGAVSVKKVFTVPENTSTVVVSFEGEENVTFRLP